jgi:hypothetical protein
VGKLKYIKNLAFYSVIDGQDILDVAIWESKEHICEFQNGVNEPEIGNCDTSHIYYGTSNENDPKFCARHFYKNVSGDGITNYKLIDAQEARSKGLV